MSNTIYEMSENLWQTLNAVRLLASSGQPLSHDTVKVINDVLKDNNPGAHIKAATNHVTMSNERQISKIVEQFAISYKNMPSKPTYKEALQKIVEIIKQCEWTKELDEIEDIATEALQSESRMYSEWISADEPPKKIGHYVVYDMNYGKPYVSVLRYSSTGKWLNEWGDEYYPQYWQEPIQSLQPKTEPTK